jgi:restriction endonuclease S subunit
MIFYKETDFKETPIGKIPRDWEVVKLKELVKADKFAIVDGPFGTQLHSSEYVNQGIPLIRVDNINKDGSFNPNNLVYITEEKWKKLKRSAIFPGDILLAKTGATIGKVCLFPECFEKGLIASSCAKISIDPSKAHNRYIFYFLLSNFGYFQIIALATGSTRPTINLTPIGKVKIAIPKNIKEQYKIVEVLSTIDEAIQKTNEVIAKTERLEKGLMQELLTKGLILGFMFDTNIFDKILDEKIELPKNLKYYVTHIQHDEILNIPMDKKERREKLLKIFNKVPKEVIATEGAAIEVSRFDLSKLMSKEDAELYDKMLKKLEELDEKSGKKKTPENRARDILIALTCMKNCLTLVTNDNNLKKVAQEFQCSVITFEQLLKGEYREFKDTEIGRIPKEWEIAKITNLFDLYKGTTPSTKVKEYWNGSIPFVTPTDITKVSDLNEIYLKTTENYITEEGLKSKGLKLVPENSLLFTSRATIGYLAINKTKVAINQGIISLIPKDTNVDITFFYYLLQKLKFLFENLAGGSTYKEISMSTFSNISVPLPSLLEQQKITEVLLTIDKKLEIERNEKTRLEKIKQAMMDLLLTGKIRIKVN